MFNEEDMQRFFNKDQEDTRTEEQQKKDRQIAARGHALQMAYLLYTNDENMTAELSKASLDDLPSILIDAAKEFYDYVYDNEKEI